MATWRAGKVARDARQILTNPNVAVFPDMPGLEEPRAPTDGGDGGDRPTLPTNVWLTTDNAVLTQVDPRTLEPIRAAAQQSLHPDLKGPLSCAHAQRDPNTGDVYNWNLELGREPTYRLFRVSATTGKTDIVAVIRGHQVKAAYWHSFYLSPSFAILCIPSSHLGWRGAKVAWERNLLDAMEPFDTSKKCQWFVVDRVHGRGVVARFETDAGFFFHTINAFEEPSDSDTEQGKTTLFCEVVEYETLDLISQLYYDVMLQKDGADRRFWGDEKRMRGSRARLVRYAFPVPQVSDKQPARTNVTAKPGEVVFSIPAPHCGELPTINPRFATRRHRYVYSLPWTGRSTSMDGIVKTDTVTREALFWNIPQGHSPGEAIFVPRPGAADQDEDDGVLLSVVLDGHARKSYLLCLDARSMTELARAEVGVAVGFGFHGAYVSSPSA
jgi:torulene dioxygenase